MRIGKQPIEILDWEAGNEGYEIIISQSYNQDELQYVSLIEIDKENTAFFYNKSLEDGMVRVFGKTKDEVLKNLCIAISGRIIGYYSDIATYSSFKSDYKFLPILVHTKLVEPENKNIPKYFIPGEMLVSQGNADYAAYQELMGKYSYTKITDSEPPIDAEGWEQIDMSFQEESYYYKSKVYKYTNLRYDLKEESIFIHSGFILTITIFVNDFMAFKEKANLQENDSLQGQCFKIANYICSRLCDKIEK